MKKTTLNTEKSQNFWDVARGWTELFSVQNQLLGLLEHRDTGKTETTTKPRCFLKLFLTSLLCCPFNSCTSELAFMNPYPVPDVTFKPDVRAARGVQKHPNPRFRQGSTPCSVENPRKPGILCKTLLSEQNHPMWGPAANFLLQVGPKGSKAVVKHLSMQPWHGAHRSAAAQHHMGAYCSDLASVACRSSHQEAAL